MATVSGIGGIGEFDGDPHAGPVNCDLRDSSGLGPDSLGGVMVISCWSVRPAEKPVTKLPPMKAPWRSCQAGSTRPVAIVCFGHPAQRSLQRPVAKASQGSRLRRGGQRAAFSLRAPVID